MFIHGKRLRYYGGNYDTFLKVRAEHRAMNAAHAKQNDRRVGHLKQFIARFGHGAKNLAKQAQSRMKMLQKIQVRHLPHHLSPSLTISHPSPTPLSPSPTPLPPLCHPFSPLSHPSLTPSHPSPPRFPGRAVRGRLRRPVPEARLPKRNDPPATMHLGDQRGIRLPPQRAGPLGAQGALPRL